MNSMIASAILFHPKPKITFDHVKITTKNLYNHIRRKEYKTYISGPPQNFDINKAAIRLGFKVEGKPLDKRKGDEAMVNLDSKGVEKTLSLAYYSNNIGTYFSLESMITHAVCYME